MSQFHVATLTGLVDLAAPQPELITTRAIAFGLAKINRWAGATELPITDAQHSLLVGRIFRRCHPRLAHWSILAELHDAHEYLLGDLISPTVRLLSARVPGFNRHLEVEKRRLDDAIRDALGIPAPPASLAIDIAAAIHDADLCAYDIEWRCLMPAANGPSPFAEHGKRMNTTGIRIKADPWPKAEEALFTALDSQIQQQVWRNAA